MPTFSPPGSLAAGALRAPLAAAAATSGAEAVEAATEDVAATEDNGGLIEEAIDRRASLTAELSDANAAASGGGCGCCPCGLLESSDIADFEEQRARAEESKPPCSLFFLRPFFISLFRKKKVILILIFL